MRVDPGQRSRMGEVAPAGWLPLLVTFFRTCRDRSWVRLGHGSAVGLGRDSGVEKSPW